MASTLLRNVPDDVRDYIFEVQASLKKKKGSCVSLETAIYKVIREHKRIKNSTDQQ